MPLTLRACSYPSRDFRDMRTRLVFRREALRGSGRCLAIGLEIGAIPLHLGEVEVILRMAHSGEKGGVALKRLDPNYSLWPEAPMYKATRQG